MVIGTWFERGLRFGGAEILVGLAGLEDFEGGLGALGALGALAVGIELGFWAVSALRGLPRFLGE